MSDKKIELLDTDDFSMIRSDGSLVGDSVPPKKQPLEVISADDFRAIRTDKNTKLDNDRFGAVKKMILNNNNKEAIRILRSDQDRDAEWHLYLAHIYIRMERFKEAKENINIAKEYDSDNAKCKSFYKLYKQCLKKYMSEPKPKAIAPMKIIDLGGPEPELGGYPVEVHNNGDFGY